MYIIWKQMFIIINHQLLTISYTKIVKTAATRSIFVAKN